DRPGDAPGASADQGAGAVPAGVPDGRAAPGAARLAAGAADGRVWRGAAGLAQGSAARPDPEPHPPLWPGARAGGGIAGRYRAIARAFPAHADRGGALCRADAWARL